MSVGDSDTEPVWLDGELARVGPYALGPRLGAGGAGTVYLATLEEDRPWGAAGTRVALKLLHPGRRLVPRALERLRREALVGMRVHHAAVVRTHEIGVHQHGVHELHYLVLEYVEGTTLSALIQGYGTVPEPLLRDLGLQIALGLQAIHAAGALHRDLKPTNVMITPDHHVKLMDLGLTHLLDEDVRLTASGMFLGTIEYAAPEQVQGDDPTTATDLYGLGVVLYEAATGRNPFAGGHHLAVLQRHLTLVPRRAGDLNPELSPFLEELLATLLHKEPAQRFSSAGEVAELLERGESTPWWRRREAQLERGGEGLLPRRLRGEGGSAFVGREPELEQLRALWRDARAGRGRALLLEGEGGVGKTRLLEELLRGLEIEREQVHLLYGAFAPGAVGVAAGALSQALLERYGAAALEAELVRRLPAMAPIMPQVAAVITGSATALPQPLPLETLHAVFSQLAAAFAEQRPTLWIVEDLHHTTVDNRSYFLALARMARERRMLIVGTAREGLPAGELEQLTRLEHARHLKLGRLQPEDVVRLVQREVPSRSYAEELGARIAAKCDGNPYFALELVRELRARGQLTPTHPSTGFHSHSLEMPSTVRELLLARLADFGREERGVLDLAAVEGFEFDPDLLARVRQERRLHVLETLADIERRHR
ncbi:MAG TPA: protein kinase [Thermoanaerobaculia bacterium]|nr:protein kinase [Thermoanaerobaculia bacterium]